MKQRYSFISTLKQAKRQDLYMIAAGFGVDPAALMTLTVRDIKRVINTARVIATVTGKHTLRASYGAYRTQSAGVKWKLEPCFDFLIKDLRVFHPQGV